MWVKDLKECPEFVAGDGAFLREVLNPLKEALALRYSLAWARVPPGRVTLLHRLRSLSEVYYILEGTGEMQIGEERRMVGPGQTVYIPPGAKQRIRNTGKDELVFLCIVDPAWRPEDEEITEK